jgi:glyoxylase-like metal-dependent hydrolase (beta-lactamase superfamily II)
MKQIYPDLWQTTVEHPFHGVNTHAYLFVQEAGNILFYSSGIREEYSQIKALGGIAYQYLSHRDEVGPALSEIKELFGSKLCCHVLEEPAVRKEASVDYLFEKRETLMGNIEVIPTPGHTNGSVCFLVDSSTGKKYLFTGDTIYVNHGKWDTRVNGYGGGSKTDLKNSLALLQDLGPAVIISSASEGDVPFVEVSKEEWRSILGKVLLKLA